MSCDDDAIPKRALRRSDRRGGGICFSDRQKEFVVDDFNQCFGTLYRILGVGIPQDIQQSLPSLLRHGRDFAESRYDV
jgi:hypothetical protein